jgi:hypothetical protein
MDRCYNYAVVSIFSDDRVEVRVMTRPEGGDDFSQRGETISITRGQQ